MTEKNLFKQIIKEFLFSSFIFRSKDKLKILILIFMIIIATGVELFSISLFIPLISSILGGEIGKDYLVFFNSIFNISHYSPIFFVIVICFIYFIKFLYLSFLNIFKNNFLFNFNYYLSSVLSKNYISQDYLFFLRNKSSDLIRNVLVETNFLTSRILSCSIQLISDLFLLLTFFIFLLFVETTGTIIVTAILILSCTIYLLLIKKKLVIWGNTRFIEEGKRLKFLQDLFFPIKEIKILQGENFFLNRFLYSHKKTNTISKYDSIIGSLPRLALEFLFIIGFTILILIMYSSLKNSEQILITLGIFAIAAFKLLPTFNSILNSIQKISLGRFSFFKILEQLKNSNLINKDVYIDGQINFNESIELKNVEFSYGDTQIKNLKKTNICIKKGTIHGIYGKSGTGKSTMLNIIVGLLKPSSGEVLVDGIKIKNNLKAWQSMIGYLPQDTFLLNEKVKNNIALGIDDNLIKSDILLEAMQKSNSYEFIKNLPKKEETIIGGEGDGLSGGQKQRIGIARTLYRNSKLLIFDESTSSLDSDNEQIVLNTLLNLKKEKTIIIVSHKKSSLGICDEVTELQ